MIWKDFYGAWYWRGYAGLELGQHKLQSTSARIRRKKRALNSENNPFIGVSRGGKNTKIHALTDGLGNPICVRLSGGNVHDVSMAETVLSHVDISNSTVLADQAYGAKAVREYMTSQNAKYCIPPKSNEKNPWSCDGYHDKERHGVECFFRKLKQFRRVATRYEKWANRFLAFVHLACICILLK